MEIDEIKQLLELLKDTDITELQIERDGSKLKIKRERFMSSFEIAPPVKSAVSAAAKEEAKKAEETQRLATITSPIVGIFHRSPAPEAPPFVEFGSTVKKGQVLCIIEAMKLMNEIESDVDGVISKILVENGQPVEYGEPLFLIEPAS
ncbi:MAG: acetyl-CoA carboxylase biotin carboxyl carrier protein [Nitrospirae bacterium]|nr:acetyl-CoA carboxylase biotin carboxyl carrier protein [Nitrospirota bacterium]